MKPALVVVLALLLGAFSALGRIGETVAELTARYGEGQKNVGKLRQAGHDQYYYEKDGLGIQCVMTDGKCVMEVIHHLGPKITDEEIQELLKTEGEGHGWGFNLTKNRWIRSDNRREAYREPGHADMFFLEETPGDKTGGLPTSGKAEADTDPEWAQSVNLIPLINPSRDATVGTWKVEAGHLVATTGLNALQIPYEPGEEYDFRIVFSRTSGNENIIQVFSQQGRPAEWIMDGWKKRTFGFERVRGKNGDDNATTVRAAEGLKNGRVYTSVLKVRKNGVAAFLDSKLISKWDTDFSDASVHDILDLPNHRALGLSSRSPAVFLKIEVREITGRGKAVSGPTSAAPLAEQKNSGTGELNRGPAHALTPPSPEMKKWLETTEAPWQAAFQHEVTDVYTAELGKLKLQYLNTLDTAIAKASSAGDLESAVSLRTEKQRFTQTPTWPEATDASARTPYLRQIQTSSRAQVARLDSDRVTRAKALQAKYDQVLAQAQMQLTQRGQLDDALQVKAKREEVAAQWLASPAPPDASAQPAKR